MEKEQQSPVTNLPEGTKMVKVRIPKMPGSKRSHIYVAVNDYKYMIKFGEWVEVPDFIAEVLEQRQERMEFADAYTSALEEQS